MALLKKIHPEWFPSEKRDLKVGETVEITDYTALVRSGAAVIVDEYGVEQPMPGVKFTCPVCFKETSTLVEFTEHIASTHSNKKEEVQKTIPEPVEPIVDETREKRLAALEKARAARKAKVGK